MKTLKSNKPLKPELLSPVSDFIMLKAAIDAGSSAVYFGAKELNMRATAKNFGLKDVKKVVDTCKKNGLKSYLTLNSVVYDKELKTLKKIVSYAKKAGVDAIICHDTSVIDECKSQKMSIIISTQASVSNINAVRYYAKMGAKKIVLARELTLEQIKSIHRKISKEKIDVELEAFAHGAMCVSMSGRCFISQFQYGRSANRGDCLQPCRRSYKVTDLETGDELDVENNYILSPKDLCALGFLDKMIDAGITSFKIEGRSRSPEYVHAVTKAYRQALDAIEKGKYDKKLVGRLTADCEKVYNRGFSNGFYFGKPINEWTADYGGVHTEKKEYSGRVVNYFPKICVAEIKIESNTFRIGDKIMFQGPTSGVFEQIAKSMQWHKKEADKAVKGQNIAIKVDKKVRKNDKVYVIKKV